MEPFIGAIFPWPLDYAPASFVLCNGQLLNIADYQALYSLIDTSFGGDGVKTFAVPNLVNRVPVGTDANLVLGATKGSETVTLTSATMPAHNHALNAYSEAGQTPIPTGNLMANTGTVDKDYNTVAGKAELAANAVSTVAGKSTSFSIKQPSFGLNFIIATEGIYPSRQ